MVHWFLCTTNEGVRGLRNAPDQVTLIAMTEGAHEARKVTLEEASQFLHSTGVRLS